MDKTGLTELWKKVKSYVDANAGGTQTTITGNAGSATKLQTTRAIDGVNFNGTADIAHYAVCYTSGSTAAKHSQPVELQTGNWCKSVRAVQLCEHGRQSYTECQQYRSESDPVQKQCDTGKPDQTVCSIELVYSGSYWYVVGDIDAAVVLSTTAVTPSATGSWYYSSAISSLNYDEIRVWLEIVDGQKGWVTPLTGAIRQRQ